jgi:hypothetical protein
MEFFLECGREDAIADTGELGLDLGLAVGAEREDAYLRGCHRPVVSLRQAATARSRRPAAAGVQD